MSRIPVLVVFVLLALGALAGTQQFVIKELLNQKYGPELVTYPFTAEKGQCLPDSLQLAGPNGPTPVQLSDIELWPNANSVKAGKVSFIVDGLTPLQTKTYTLSYGAQAVKPLAGDLAVAKTADGVEVTTGRVGARFVVGGQTYPAPKPANEVPGPLTGLRLGNGAWSGHSEFLKGAAGVTTWSAQLTDSGPVFARARFSYTLTDGNSVTLSATVIAGDSAIRWEMAVKADHPDQALTFTWATVPGVKQATLPSYGGQWSKDRTAPVTAGADKPVCLLTPATSIAGAFPDSPAFIKLTGADRELQFRSREPGAWTEIVKPQTYLGNAHWNLDMISKMWADGWQRLRVPLFYGNAGEVTMPFSLAKGRRLWSVSSGAAVIGERLDAVKDMVLEWPADPKIGYPHLFVSKAEEEAAWKREAPDAARLGFLYGVGGYPGWKNEGFLYGGGTKESADKAKIVPMLHDFLGLLGDYDMMRNGIAIVAMYDGLNGTDLLTPADKSLFRSQLAAMGYALADPTFWNSDRGYCSGNPNMTCSNICTLGVLACEIPDHPMAKQWADYTAAWMESWLANEVGPNGEWMCEGMHYGTVSLTPMVTFAIAAKRAGFHDFTNDERLKKALLYYAKYTSPADPQRAGKRVFPPIGRGLAGETSAMFGVMAKATAQSDPAFSKTMEWMWAQQGYPNEFGDWRMGGFEPLYMDKTLPQQPPAWSSEVFPTLGVVFRNGFGTFDEHYLAIRSHVDSLRNLDVWTPEVGGIALWYAYGKPVSKTFTFQIGYQERNELTRDGVLIAHTFDGTNSKTPFGYYTTTQPQAVATQPGADYARTLITNTKIDDRAWWPAGKVPTWPKVPAATGTTLAWTRQALFLKDADPNGPTYLVLRDSTKGGQPTQWQFWSLTQLLDTPAIVAAAGPTAKPAADMLNARQLAQGDRYTALGQFGVDMEYFIANPADTPRNTLRYGGPDNNRVPEYADLLHLQLPGDGAYYVALVPRKTGAPAPTFAKLDGGRIIKVSGAFGADYAFLSEDAAEASGENVGFKGTAGAIQVRPEGATLTLGADGIVFYQKFRLVAQQAASLRIAGNTLTLTPAPGFTGGAVTLNAPAGYKLQAGGGVTLQVKGNAYLLTIPAGVTTVTLAKK